MKIRSFIKLCAKIYKTKAAKVALLGVCSTMLLVSSGASFAKYYSENGFGDGASIAELGGGQVKYSYEMMQTPKELSPSIDADYYACMATFMIEFDSSEVSRDFSLDLKIAKNTSDNYLDCTLAEYNTFVLPSNMIDAYGNAEDYVFPSFVTNIEGSSGTSYKVNTVLPIPQSVNSNDISNASNRERWDEFYKDLKLSKFSPNTLYYSYALEENVTYNSDNTIKDIDYTWCAAPFTASTTGMTNVLDGFVLNGVLKHGTDKLLPLNYLKMNYYFQIVFFSHFYVDDKGTVDNKIDDTLNNENSKILSKLTITQTGG